MKEQMEYIVEIHTKLGTIEGKLDSLNCAKNEKEMYCMKLEQNALKEKVEKMPSKAWYFIASVITIIVTIVGVFAGIIKEIRS